ncbi:hypothetical protein PUN28_020250 [Cardiocondyla obscurior]|uniref:Uncharacterized protein n=1 Tax=Cardiocondyla obscurior TaxID=286306 RepID=A0AAW2EB85_9HYME
MKSPQGGKSSRSRSTTRAAYNDTRPPSPIRLSLTIPGLIDPYVIMRRATHARRHARLSSGSPGSFLHFVFYFFFRRLRLCIFSLEENTHTSVLNMHARIHNFPSPFYARLSAYKFY